MIALQALHLAYFFVVLAVTITSLSSSGRASSCINSTTSNHCDSASVLEGPWERHPVSPLSWSIKVVAGRPIRMWPWRRDKRKRSLASSCFARQQCPANCILRLRIIIEMSGLIHKAVV